MTKIIHTKESILSMHKDLLKVGKFIDVDEKMKNDFLKNISNVDLKNFIKLKMEVFCFKCKTGEEAIFSATNKTQAIIKMYSLIFEYGK